MTASTHTAVSVLAGSIDVPPSYYDRAVKRYESLGEWLSRDQSSLAQFHPTVYPQGSFRYGTVVQALDPNQGYDLDLVIELQELRKVDVSQKGLKEMVGRELKAYAEAHSMQAEPEPTKRCWHLDYADDVHFHIDILPSVPEDEDTKAAIAAANGQHDPTNELATLTIALTDKTHVDYERIGGHWPHSNPRGFAQWFEDRMRPVATQMLEGLGKAVEEVPTYQWKTPLQQAIQILKRHRDVMFKEQADLKPISMIITTLATLSYEGQNSVDETVTAIVDRMMTFIRKTAPRIPNPVDPGEDFADKWSDKSELEDAFLSWHRQLRRDIRGLGDSVGLGELQEHFQERFSVGLGDSDARLILPGASVIAPAATPAVAIKRRTEPWTSIE